MNDAATRLILDHPHSAPAPVGLVAERLMSAYAQTHAQTHAQELQP